MFRKMKLDEVVMRRKHMTPVLNGALVYINTSSAPIAAAMIDGRRYALVDAGSMIRVVDYDTAVEKSTPQYRYDQSSFEISKDDYIQSMYRLGATELWPHNGGCALIRE